MRYREILEACWTGYRQSGMKRKGSRMVPNCVPVSEQQPLDMTGAPDPTVAAYFQTKAELEALQKATETGEGGRATYVANPQERAKFIARLQANIQRLEGELQQKGLLSAVQQAEAQWQGAQQRSIKKSSANRHYPEMTTAQLEENLRDWFREKWVRFGPDGKIRGDCARGSKSEGKPKCLPQSKAHSLGKKGRAQAAARKRRQDPNPDRSGAAINVATKKS